MLICQCIKTVELTKLQVGSESRDIRLVASTIPEIEYLLDYLKNEKEKGAAVTVGKNLACRPRMVKDNCLL